jgi:S-adenosylmethionine:tRNA ribosyltransferase-isomerase
MRVDDLDFHLPSNLIAQAPTAERPAARLLHYRRDDRSITHRQFSDIVDLLRPGDLLVMNNTRVLPARFMLIKSTGGRVEGLFVREQAIGQWEALLRNASPVTGTSHYELVADDAPPLAVTIESSLGSGQFVLNVATDQPATAVLSRYGRMPLPPYIRREKQRDERDEADRNRYQTVYAASGTSVAAPTAGLHFDDALLGRLKARGVLQTFVTLEVGMGTFKPVEVNELADHKMHVERYTIPLEAAAAVNAAKAEGRRVIAVGTTSARVLESQSASAPIEPWSGETGIFIYPPYSWRFVDALITNFHLPRSTLIALVAAFVGLDEQRRMYAEAIAQRYRFFSYGDSSFLE